MTRREVITAAAALAGQAARLAGAQTSSSSAAPTKFQIGCMTLPYGSFSLQRALEGIAKAGCRYVGWAGSFADAGGQRKPLLAADAPASEAKQLAQRCRDLGLAFSRE